MSDSVITTDLDFKITYVNKAFQRLYGYTADELIGKSPDFLNAEANSREIQEDIYRTVSSGEVWTGELKNRRKNGDFFKEAQSVANIGSYMYNVEEDSWTGSTVFYELFGIDGCHKRTFTSWLELVHPEQRAEMREYFKTDVLENGKRFDREYRIIRKNDGEIR